MINGKPAKIKYYTVGDRERFRSDVNIGGPSAQDTGITGSLGSESTRGPAKPTITITMSPLRRRRGSMLEQERISLVTVLYTRSQAALAECNGKATSCRTPYIYMQNVLRCTDCMLLARSTTCHLSREVIPDFCLDDVDILQHLMSPQIVHQHGPSTVSCCTVHT